MDGLGVFACHVGNETYISKAHEPITYNKTSGYLFLESISPEFEFRLFVLEGIFGTGDYEFDNTNEEWVNLSYDTFFGIDSTGINQLTISKLDLSENIIAGTFNIDLVATDSTRKLVREGRFDLEMNIIE
ncbi:MAG: hypothetical protein GQ574_21300 [Crocinitomix sp.]|nr:hypothetical protein [Crocinitomix sp.]